MHTSFFIKRNAGKTAYFLLLYHEEMGKSIDFDSLSQFFLYKFVVAFLANIDKSTGRNRSIRCFCGMFFLNMFLLAAQRRKAHLISNSSHNINSLNNSSINRHLFLPFSRIKFNRRQTQATVMTASLKSKRAKKA